MNHLCCKFSPIGNLSPHYTLTVVMDQTVDHTMDRGSKLKKTPPAPPQGSERIVDRSSRAPPSLLPSLLCVWMAPHVYAYHCVSGEEFC